MLVQIQKMTDVSSTQPSRLLADDDDDTFGRSSNNHTIDLTRRVQTNFTITRIVAMVIALITRNSESSPSFRKQFRKTLLCCTINFLIVISLISVMIPMTYFIAGTSVMLPTNPYDRYVVLSEIIENHQ